MVRVKMTLTCVVEVPTQSNRPNEIDFDTVADAAEHEVGRVLSDNGIELVGIRDTDVAVMADAPN